MPQQRATKHFHTFVGGLNTEVSPLVYPDNTAVELENMELQVDGSLRRRKGLAAETSSISVEIASAFANGTSTVTEHFWRNIAGTDEHLHVVQAGYELYFWSDGATSFSTGLKGYNMDIRQFKVQLATATDAEIAAEPIDFSWGRGQALVTQKYLEPFFLTFDATLDTITATPINVRIRDFIGIEDGLQNTTLPTSLSADHEYNLRNRGWTAAQITAFNTSTSTTFPSLNMIPYLGQKRTLTASTSYDHDGVRVWTSARIEDEGFGNGSAPQGKFFVNPFRDATVGADADADDIEITTWTTSPTVPTGGATDVTITTASAHGLSVGVATVVEGQLSNVNLSLTHRGGAFIIPRDFTFSGTYTTLTGTTASTIVISVDFPANFAAWVDQYKQLGVIQTALANSVGSDVLVRPTTNAYFAGRAWYAGTPAGVVGQHVLFSQIIERNSQYGRCYQANDPTSEQAPDLLESDGGLIFIPEAGRILKLQPFGQSMLVLAVNGVWEIDGGQNRYFDATDFAVRRVTGSGCISRESVIEAEDNIIYASEEGAFRIFTDPESRVLVAQNFTLEKVQSKWAAIDSVHKSSMKTLYDPVKKRLLFMYDTSASPTVPTWNYREVLLYDARLEAWYPFTFPLGTDFAADTFVKGFTKPEAYASGGEAIIKILTWEDTASKGLQWNEFTDDTNFQDLAEIDATGFLTTGYEGMGDMSKDKQVRYITTFMSRIEDSSLQFRGRWDFADLDISGKWTPQKEAYRPPRIWVGAHGTDGYPVVTSKHSMPGQGQVLSIRYDTVATEDAHIYGWSIDFQGIQD